MQPDPGTAFTLYRQGMEEGPLYFTDLQVMARSGTLKADTLVRRDGGNWFNAREIPGLFSTRSWLTAIVLAAVVGSLGIDRMYVGHIGLGILKLITCGGLGIWQIVDLILFATNKVTDNHGLPLQR